MFLKRKLDLKPEHYVLMGTLAVATVMTNLFFYTYGRTKGAEIAMDEIGKRSLGLEDPKGESDNNPFYQAFKKGYESKNKGDV